MGKIQVISAAELDGINKDKIEKIFSAKHKELPQFDYCIDEKIIGGVLIIDGDNYYDGTVQGQLSKLKKTL